MTPTKGCCEACLPEYIHNDDGSLTPISDPTCVNDFCPCHSQQQECEHTELMHLEYGCGCQPSCKTCYPKREPKFIATKIGDNPPTVTTYEKLEDLAKTEQEFDVTGWSRYGGKPVKKQEKVEVAYGFEDGVIEGRRRSDERWAHEMEIVAATAEEQKLTRFAERIRARIKVVLEAASQEKIECDHQCSGNCRRVGCNCACGEFHGKYEPNSN